MRPAPAADRAWSQGRTFGLAGDPVGRHRPEIRGRRDGPHRPCGVGGTTLSVMVPKIALACGILAPLLFVATDFLAGLQPPADNFIRTSISELSAFGAPTRAYVLPLLITQSLLLATFGVGIWLQAEQNI